MWNLPFRKTPKRPNPYSGQALLIILLVMSVVLTTVLSVVSRSVTDISITTYEDESVRALSAAEAGVEEAFISGLGAPFIDVDLDLDSKTSFTTTITASGIDSNEFAHPVKLKSGETTTFWMVSHDSGGNLICDDTYHCFKGNEIQILWGNLNTDSDVYGTPAIEVSIYYDSGVVSGPNPRPVVDNGDYKDVLIKRVTFDPNGPNRTQNNFSTAVSVGDYTIGDKHYHFSSGIISFTPADLNISCREEEGCILMVRVRMFYNDVKEPVGIVASAIGQGALPAQGITIDSTGTSGESTRKLRVFRSFPEPPLVFDSSLFSYGSLEK